MKLNNLNLGITPEIANAVHHAHTWCKVYGNSDYEVDSCAVNPESINYISNDNIQGNQHYGNTFNANWRNHPNFS